MSNNSMHGGIAEQLLKLGLVSKNDYNHHKTIEAIEKKDSKKNQFSYRDSFESSKIVRKIELYNLPIREINQLFEMIKEALLNDYTSIKKIVLAVHTLRDNKILCEPDSPHNDPYNVIPFTLNLRKALGSEAFLNASSYEQEKQIKHLFKVREKEFPTRRI